MKPRVVDISLNYTGNIRPSPLAIKQRPKILLIDDSPIVRIMIGRFLKGKNYDVVVASSGEEGLERFDEEKFDAVILNEVLPGMYGTVVADKIRNTNPQIPIFMVTGSDIINGNPKQVAEQHRINAIFPKTTNTLPLIAKALEKEQHLQEILTNPVEPITMPSVTPSGAPMILVVDSSQTVLKMLKSEFEKMGFNVTTASNATDAWHTFKESPEKFNLVITANFVGLDRGGIALGNMVKALRPEIPVILHTSDDIGYLEAKDIEIFMKTFPFTLLMSRAQQLLSKAS